MTTLAQAVKRCVQEAGGKATADHIKRTINKEYPGKWKPATFQTILYASSINSPKAYIHHPFVEKTLYRNAEGDYELYSEEQHGPNIWAPAEEAENLAPWDGLRWEYKTLLLDLPPDSLDALLNEHGEQGWELAAAFPSPVAGSVGVLYMLKRTVLLSLVVS